MTALGTPPSDVALPLDEGRTFREPWQAKAFALVVLLHREGHFAWDDWVQTLAAEIKASPQRPDEDADLAYHRQFLTALEQIVSGRGLVVAEAMVQRKQAWLLSMAATAMQTVRAEVKAMTWRCFEMSVLQGMPAVKVARELGIAKPNNVYVYVFRVIQRVRELAREMGAFGEFDDLEDDERSDDGSKPLR